MHVKYNDDIHVACATGHMRKEQRHKAAANDKQIEVCVGRGQIVVGPGHTRLASGRCTFATLV